MLRQCEIFFSLKITEEWELLSRIVITKSKDAPEMINGKNGIIESKCSHYKMYD